MHEATPAERELAGRLLDAREKRAIVALIATETEAAAAARLHISVRQFQRVLEDIRAKLGFRPLFALGGECQRLGLIDWDAVERERERERTFGLSLSPGPSVVAPIPPRRRPAPRPRP